MVKNELDYTVSECLDDLDGHELDRVIRIKLANGDVKIVDGIQFLNASIGGDDIIYIKELDPLWVKYHNEVLYFVKKAQVLSEYLISIIECGDKYEDTDFALDMIITLAREVDHWLNVLKIEHDFEILTGPDNEIVDKLKLLDDWVYSH